MNAHSPSFSIYLSKFFAYANYDSFLFGTLHFFGVPHLATYIFFLFVNEPGLGTLISLTLVALTPFPSSVG